MKKVMLSLAVVGLFGLSSCKKDYTCTCTYTVDGDVVGTTEAKLEDSKKSDAEDSCVGGTSFGDATAECELEEVD